MRWDGQLCPSLTAMSSSHATACHTRRALAHHLPFPMTRIGHMKQRRPAGALE
ncbi:hypothetical protein PHLGIDRAFT_225758 [Phlebiopsis gigantea 11061_1 CR5-6]|uniref:Uncharacterized protein n=1 Tax=Phlebiopsis gigantea (strain 11061_1 CR5-6) TaxID=745531 RepID=A0A0C3PEC1_PHLG1|nr:hypothetical protein PHLGIDRAFT_225758 [Phlebiopsis gigantea 11061_1 CR5-6]